MNRTKPLAVAFLALLGGCDTLQNSQLPFWVSQNEQPVAQAATVEKPHRQNWLSNRSKAVPPKVSRRDRSLGGAAYRQEGFVHVLDNRSSHKSGIPIVYPPTVSLSASTAVQMGRANSEVYGRSIYEQERWDRYCNRGHGMDLNDVKFIQRTGVQNVPGSLRATCELPPFDLSEYSKAWSRHCSGNTTTADQRIVTATQMPYYLKQSCSGK
ncbi:hypothetical protein PsAD37_03347 [Pseudovibrio sp. Ad37]|nr:hypothetical protein PsAD37_03347 [Pseudovibrio sp. Ad37]